MQKIMFDEKFGLNTAVLNGTKTMTRRKITYPSKFKGENVAGYFVCRRPSGEVTEICMYDEDERMIDGGQILPRYKVGEVVAIAQSYETMYHEIGLETMDMFTTSMKNSKCWNNKMFVKADLMPHHIRITDVKAERLQDISEEDCLKEGIVDYGLEYDDYGDPQYGHKNSQMFINPIDAFRSLIDKVSGKGTWNTNPHVWVYEFELLVNR